MQPQPKLRVIHGGARPKLPPMSEPEFDRKMRDLAVGFFGFLLGLLSLAWWRVG